MVVAVILVWMMQMALHQTVIVGTVRDRLVTASGAWACFASSSPQACAGIHAEEFVLPSEIIDMVIVLEAVWPHPEPWLWVLTGSGSGWCWSATCK